MGLRKAAYGRNSRRGLPNAPSGTIEVHGSVDGAPLDVEAAVDRRGEKAIRVLVQQADWKSAHLEGDMSSDVAMTQSRGQLRMRIGQLSDLKRLLGIDLAGSVEGSVGFVPTNGPPQVHAELTGKDLSLGPFAGDLQLQGTGASDALRVQLSAQLPQLYGAPAVVSSAGVLNLGSRDCHIDTASVGYRRETLKLLARVRLAFGQGLSVDDFKVGAEDAIFELKGQFAPTLDLRAVLVQVDPRLVNVFFPGLLATGALQAHARLQGSFESPTGDIGLDANNVRFADDAAAGLPALDLHARAQLADDSAAIKATLTTGAGAQVSATGTAPLNANGALDRSTASWMWGWRIPCSRRAVCMPPVSWPLMPASPVLRPRRWSRAPSP